MTWNQTKDFAMNEVSHNTQRIKIRFEFQIASILYVENITEISFHKSVKDIWDIYKTTSYQARVDMKSSRFYFVSYDRYTKRIEFQNNLGGHGEAEKCNTKDSNAESLYAKACTLYQWS